MVLEVELVNVKATAAPPVMLGPAGLGLCRAEPGSWRRSTVLRLPAGLDLRGTVGLRAAAPSAALGRREFAPSGLDLRACNRILTRIDISIVRAQLDWARVAGRKRADARGEIGRKPSR